MVRHIVIVQCPAALAFLPLLRQSVTTLCEPVMGDTEMYQVQLAVSELATNIVVHAYRGMVDGTITFEAVLEEDRVVLDLFDTGVTFAAVEPLAPDVDALLEGGYGLFIIQQTMDVMAHSRGADERNHWHLEKRLPVAAHEGGNAQWM